MSDVRCSSCGRRVGMSPGVSPLRNRVYCDSWCADEQEVTPTECRTDYLAALHHVKGMSPGQAGKVFGLAHAQVYGALDRINARWK